MVNDLENELEDAKELIDELKISRLNELLHIYQDGIFVCDDELIEAKIFEEGHEVSKINTLKKCIKLATKQSGEVESPAKYIAFNNCVFDLEEFKAKEFSPTEFKLTNKLSIDYVELTKISADVGLINKFFRKATDNNPELEQLLYTLVGMCFYRSIAFPFAWVLTGNIDNRKIFLDAIKAIGGNCVSHKNLKELSDAKNSYDLYSKTCNIAEEVERPKIDDMSNIRKLILGKQVEIDKWFCKCKFTPYATMIINISEILDFGDELFKLKDFFKIIPLNKKSAVSKKMAEKLLAKENLQYITFRGLTAYCQALRNKTPIIPKVVEAATKLYFLDNNSVQAYFEENPFKEIQYKSRLYYDYRLWCTDACVKKFDRAHFGTEVKKLGYEPKRYSFKNKRIQCYVAEGFDINKCRKKYKKFLEQRGITNFDNDAEFVENLIDFFEDYNNGEGEEKDGNELCGNENDVEREIYRIT